MSNDLLVIKSTINFFVQNFLAKEKWLFKENSYIGCNKKTDRALYPSRIYHTVCHITENDATLVR